MQYRALACIKIQKTVRMWLCKKKHKPRWVFLLFQPRLLFSPNWNWFTIMRWDIFPQIQLFWMGVHNTLQNYFHCMISLRNMHMEKKVLDHHLLLISCTQALYTWHWFEDTYCLMQHQIEESSRRLHVLQTLLTVCCLPYPKANKTLSLFAYFFWFASCHICKIYKC